MIDPTEFEKGIEAMEGEAKWRFLLMLKRHFEMNRMDWCEPKIGDTIQVRKPERMTQ